MSIIFLIISPNMIRILLGRDGLRLVFCCFVIYYQNVKSYNAGILTALSVWLPCELYAKLTNSMAHETRRFNAAFTRALQ